MSQNQESTLIVTMIVTLCIIGGVAWLFFKQVTPQNPTITTPPTSNPPTPPTSNPATPPTSNPATTATSSSIFARVPNIPTGLFRYGGSTTWAPIRAEVDSVIQNVWPDFKLRYTEHPTKAAGSGTGISMLLEDALDFAQSSRSLKEEEYTAASTRGFTLKQIAVAIDGIAVGVNPNLNVRGLTVKQLQGIYTGQITNWNQIGGDNIPIIPYSRRPEDSGTIEFFVDNILGKEAFGDNVRFISTTTEALRKIASEPGAIYYASAPELVPQCTIKPLAIGKNPSQLITPYIEPLISQEDCPSRRNQLNITAFQTGEYPITRSLFVIIKENGQIAQEAGEAYSNLLLSEQGQQLISKTGFVRIK
ncbi:PstS family phosphate ABC transporter substrate-binding protein [[Phormidium] sp. ETS-05]|uniref:PstS family phosphate ABC transporter substrate-binding protein n=1 Tax=[Phormidium] sp. ETS-05 TaxID=222819 RepID=UPI0018EEEE9D|nr:substrate-binding domain-containing protein [[Phormidium] sp. ETS-05]